MHAMDDAHKVIDLQNANKELLQDIDQLLESGGELYKELEKKDLQHEQYMDALLKRQMALADELIG